jgi:Arylsulfatase regulator (Fe-S oxidoreductase)
VITTNGLLIDEKWAETLLRRNVDLTFSVDSPTREVYEKIRKGADFDVLLRNLRNFNRLKEQAKSPVKTNLHIVVMRSNYRQLEDYLDFAAEHGFKYAAFLAIGGNHENPENIFYNNDADAIAYLKKALPRIREKAARNGILLENRLPVKEETAGGKAEHNEPAGNDNVSGEARPRTERRMICHLPWIQMYIDYDGSIRPDCVCRREVSLGKVPDTTLNEAWNNAAMRGTGSALRRARPRRYATPTVPKAGSQSGI